MFSDPVIGADFVGREEILEIIQKRVEAFINGYRQNIALIGHRQLGKTSILHQFLHTYRATSVLPIYVELKPQALDYFVDQFVRSLLFEYLRQKESINAAESYETLIVLAEKFIPRTAQEIKSIQHDLQKGDTDSAYARLFELTSFVHKETGVQCIVILDEFHRLGEFPVKNSFQNFGKRIMLQKDTMYLISSSSFTVSRHILAEKLALLFGNFERIYLEPFSFEISDAFIDRKLDPVKIPDDLKHYLIALTNGHPFFLNVICRELRQVALVWSKETINENVLVESLKRLFFDSDGILNQYFGSLISGWASSIRGNHLLMLVQLANGSNRLKALAQVTKRSIAETSRRLKDLMAEELIEKNGVFYHFHDKLFQFWLKHVYQTKEFSLLVDMPSKAANFRSECLKNIQRFKTISQLAPRERIIGLFKCFHDDRVEFESKGKQLPAFQEISGECGTSAESRKPIIAKTRGQQSWFCQILEKKSTEKDVLDFIKQSSDPKNNRLKKVLITLDGMDDNAKLLAKNKKIWTLGLQKINTLMDFYGLSKIVSVKRKAIPLELTVSSSPRYN